MLFKHLKHFFYQLKEWKVKILSGESQNLNQF